MIWYSSDIEFPIFDVEENIVIYLFICCCFQIRSRSIWIKDVDFRFDNYYLFCSKNIFEYTLATLFGF